MKKMGIFIVGCLDRGGAAGGTGGDDDDGVNTLRRQILDIGQFLLRLVV